MKFVNPLAPFQIVVFLCEGRALEVAKAVLPSHSPPGYAVGCFAGAKSAGMRGAVTEVWY